MIQMGGFLGYWFFFFCGSLWTGLPWKEYIKTVTMILFSRLSFADVLCWGKNALFWKSFWSSGKLKISNVLLPFELPCKKILEIFIFWTKIIQCSWCFKAWEHKCLEEKKVTFNICIYWEEDISALEMQASLCPLSCFPFNFFFGTWTSSPVMCPP